MKMSSFRYIFPQSLKSLRLNGWMSFAAVLTVTIALFLCATFWLLVQNIDANARKFESDVRVLAYIIDTIEPTAYSEIEERIRNIEGVAAVEYVDKEEGLAWASQRMNTDLAVTLDYENPLPDMYSITATGPDEVAVVAEAVRQIPQIDAETVRYGEESVDKLFRLTDTMRRVGLIIMALLGVAAVILVAMTIRLTVLSRKKELQVMKWVGATNAFIRWPFFIEGILLGLFGAALAAGLVLLCYNNAGQWLAETISFVIVLDFQSIWLQTCIFTLAAGLLMGVFGCLISVSRFLNV